MVSHQPLGGLKSEEFYIYAQSQKQLRARWKWRQRNKYSREGLEDGCRWSQRVSQRAQVSLSRIASFSLVRGSRNAGFPGSRRNQSLHWECPLPFFFLLCAFWGSGCDSFVYTSVRAQLTLTLKRPERLVVSPVALPVASGWDFQN